MLPRTSLDAIYERSICRNRAFYKAESILLKYFLASTIIVLNSSSIVRKIRSSPYELTDNPLIFKNSPLHNTPPFHSPKKQSRNLAQLMTPQILSLHNRTTRSAPPIQNPSVLYTHASAIISLGLAPKPVSTQAPGRIFITA